MGHRRNNFVVVFKIIFVFLSIWAYAFSLDLPAQDDYLNATSGIDVFGIPSIIYGGEDSVTGNAVITHISSSTQTNKYLCFRVSCDNFNIKDSSGGSPQLTTYNNIMGLNCVNSQEIPSTGVIELYCGVNLKEKLDYVLSENTFYDLYFESPDILKSYEEPSGEYANEVYYTDKAPGENITLKLYVRDTTNNNPVYFPPNQDPISILYIRETYSLNFLKSESNYRLCSDRTCFFYNVTIPIIGTPKKSLFISPLIILGAVPQDTSLASYCRGDTSNNCISKVVLLYPKIYHADLSISGEKDSDGKYYYGQNISINFENYNEYDIGDGGNIISRRLIIYNGNSIIKDINFNPNQQSTYVLPLNTSFKGKNLNIVYEVSYENKYGDVLKYNDSVIVNVSDTFAYDISLDYNITTVREEVDNEDINGFIAGSDIIGAFRTFIKDKENHIIQAPLSITNMWLSDGNKEYPLEFEEISNENFTYLHEKTYVIHLPDSLLMPINAFTLKVKVSGVINGERISKTIEIPTSYSIIPSNVTMSGQLFFSDEKAFLKVLFNDVVVGSLDDIKLYSSLHSNESWSLQYNEDNNGYYSNVSFNIPQINYGALKGMLSFKYSLNNGEYVFEKFIDVINKLPGWGIVLYIDKEGIKERLDKGSAINVSFEHPYDVKKLVFYIRNLGERNIDLSYLKVYNNDEDITDAISFEDIIDKDNKANIFSPGEEYKMIIYGYAKEFNNENIIEIEYKGARLFNLTLRKKLKSTNSSIDVSIKNGEIIYKKDKGKGSFTLSLTTDIDHLGELGIKAKISSKLCSPFTLVDDKHIYFASRSGTHDIDVSFSNSVIGKCGSRVNITNIVYVVKDNKTFTLITKTEEVNVKELKESNVGQMMNELSEYLNEIESLCDSLGNQGNSSCAYADINQICNSWLSDAKAQKSQIDVMTEEGKNTLRWLHSNASNYLSQMEKCNYTLSYSESFSSLREKVRELYKEVCENKENYKKIKSHLQGEDLSSFENSCSMYGNIITNSNTGSLSLYREAMNALSYYAQYLSEPEKKPPYGKYLMIFIVLLLIVVIVGYLVVKYTSSKPPVEVNEEDLYAI